MSGRRKWLWLVGVAALSACGSPGTSHPILKLDGGEEPGDEDSGSGQEERPDAPLLRDAPVDGPVLETAAPAPDLKPSPDGVTCMGCWDGTKCQGGADIAACGV